MIHRLYCLLLSPFSLAKTVLLGVLMLTMLRFGATAEAKIIGQVTIFQTLSMFIYVFIKFGSDVELVKAARDDKTLFIEARRAYLATLRGRFAFCIVGLLAGVVLSDWMSLKLGISIALSGIVLTAGNLLRITESPNLHILYDVTLATVVMFYASYMLQLPVDDVILAFVLSQAILTAALLLVLGNGNLATERLPKLINPYYFASELTILIYTAGTVLLLATELSDAEVGTFRAVERLAFAGTFVLLIVNNRAFFDLSREKVPELTLSTYLQRYALPCALFYGAVFGALITVSFTRLGNVIADNRSWFLILAAGYCVSAAVGPVATFLNVVGRERGVLTINILSVLLFGAFFLLWRTTEDATLLVVGTAVATSAANVTMFVALARRLRSWPSVNRPGTVSNRYQR